MESDRPPASTGNQLSRYSTSPPPVSNQRPQTIIRTIFLRTETVESSSFRPEGTISIHTPAVVGHPYPAPATSSRHGVLPILAFHSRSDYGYEEPTTRTFIHRERPTSTSYALSSTFYILQFRCIEAKRNPQSYTKHSGQPDVLSLNRSANHSLGKPIMCCVITPFACS